jgi:hypothetical protein
VWLSALIVGITGGLLVWSLVGSLILLSLVFEHGRDRTELVLELRKARIAEGLPPKGP